MKMNSNFFKRGLLLHGIIFCINLNILAQSTAICIFITGIEYDDPGFSLLKESIQKNKNVTSVKSGYDQCTPKFNLNYNRTAQNIWVELPYQNRYDFENKNDSTTGKPAIFVKGYICFSG